MDEIKLNDKTCKSSRRGLLKKLVNVVNYLNIFKKKTAPPDLQSGGFKAGGFEIPLSGNIRIARQDRTGKSEWAAGYYYGSS